MKHLIPGLIVFLCLAGSSAALTTKEQGMMLKKATWVLEESLTAPDEKIPEQLLGRAMGIVILPEMVKGGFGAGGQFGQGVASVRHPKTRKWGPPVFLTTLGASIGFQIGLESVDLVLMLMSHRGVMGLVRGQFKLGGDIALAAGSLGRHAEANVDLLMQGKIFSYSRSKGAFAGISILTSAFSFDNESNDSFYGRTIPPEIILFSPAIEGMPERGLQFMRRLNRLAPPDDLPKKLPPHSVKPRKKKKPLPASGG